MRPFPEFRPKAVHPYAWLWEPLESDPSFVLRTMFGAKSVYLGGQLQLCFPHKEEPWRGLLVCTDKTHHPSLIRDFPVLAPHPVLPKWLYLSDSSDAFDSTAERLVERVRRRDSRIGVTPQSKKRKKA